MTTLDPGASVVFTHGLLVRPRSTAFLASSAAPIITCGLEVLVQEVIAAITTEPWSTSNGVPSSPVTVTGWDGRPRSPAAPARACGSPPASTSAAVDGGSEAGNDSATAWSTGEATPLLT